MSPFAYQSDNRIRDALRSPDLPSIIGLLNSRSGPDWVLTGGEDPRSGAVITARFKGEDFGEIRNEEDEIIISSLVKSSDPAHKQSATKIMRRLGERLAQINEDRIERMITALSTPDAMGAGKPDRNMIRHQLVQLNDQHMTLSSLPRHFHIDGVTYDFISAHFSPLNPETMSVTASVTIYSSGDAETVKVGTCSYNQTAADIEVLSNMFEDAEEDVPSHNDFFHFESEISGGNQSQIEDLFMIRLSGALGIMIDRNGAEISTAKELEASRMSALMAEAGEGPESWDVDAALDALH